MDEHELLNHVAALANQSDKPYGFILAEVRTALKDYLQEES